MTTVLQCAIGADELLSTYGEEVLQDGTTIKGRWYELTHPWVAVNSHELGDLRQIMLQIHKEINPTDSRWRESYENR